MVPPENKIMTTKWHQKSALALVANLIICVICPRYNCKWINSCRRIKSPDDDDYNRQNAAAIVT